MKWFLVVLLPFASCDIDGQGDIDKRKFILGEYTDYQECQDQQKIVAEQWWRQSNNGTIFCEQRTKE